MSCSKGNDMTNSPEIGLGAIQYLERLKDEFRQLQDLEPLRGSFQHDRMKIVERELSEMRAEQPVPVL